LTSFNVIGCGRVGQTLAALLHQHGQVQVQDLHSRSFSSAEQAAQFVGAGQPVANLADMRAADVWLLSVPDAQVAAAAQALAEAQGNKLAGAVVFHNSGFLSAAVLQPLQALGCHVASAHPVLNFASPDTGVRQFAGTPCGLEGDAPALAWLHTALTAIGGRCFEIASSDKPLYHAAAVFSSNFTVVLQGIAQDAWQSAGVPPELMRPLTEALLKSTVDNVLAMGPAKALTGPAARGDTAVVQAQGEVVKQWNAPAGEAYALLSQLAAELKQRA
jgi:pyrroline-5-carboxylate reductase